jgi:DNA-binding transcriptional ArsR family regulator
LPRAIKLSQKDKFLDKGMHAILLSHMAHLDRVFHSLSDSTRRAVIAQLALGPTSVGDLAQRHHMALPSFMKHIRVLEESEIIVSRKTGRVRICELRPEALKTAQGWLEKERRIWETRLNQLDNFVEALAEKENESGNK